MADKYDPGTVSTFDTSEKGRAPAWCDRVLWRTDETESSPTVVEPEYYGSVQQVVSSDHKPVKFVARIRMRGVQ